ncbi:MAG TPA: 2-oxoglutarate dehydrogenase, E2 component, dihydrolipoamide succinyltransferase [Candidatus Acidoferrales bacterium]|nr:2-oxoglutarate dehydrogenase, E2 component, dihydrolipoamide succinyltransferase [Candidatus Acidoferrales bacterium]
MAVDVVMPQMGESIFEGTITKWLKKPGDKIERDEPLFEISTDKVDAEIPSPAAGVLKEIKVNEGQTVPIQTIVALIDADGAAAATSAAAPAPAKQQSAPPAAQAKPAPAPPASGTKAAPTPFPSAGASPASQQPAAASVGGEKIRSSPLVRRIARENNIDLAQVPGTGAGGRVSKQDILGAVGGGAARSGEPASAGSPASGGAIPFRAPAAPPPPAGGATASAVLETAVPRERLYFGQYEVQPMSVMRQKIAEHMVLSKRVSPHVYSVDEADMTAIATVRAKLKEKFEQTTGTKLTFMPFFVRAAVEALRAFPTVNASVDGTNIVLHKEANIGIAVALDWGLIVPVIKNAEEKNFLGIARAINDLAERARAKKLKPDEVAESTFSITNPGVFGGLFGLPVINQPNVAILGLGAIEKRPVVVDDAIAIRSMVYLTLSYDHRVVDGAAAHQFMGKLKHTLENWTESIL